MQPEVPTMPNRTIYVSDADVPLFEKAQALAGGNLSAAIAQALRRFVEAQEIRNSGFEEITVRVGKQAHVYKRFQGRLIARGYALAQHDTRRIYYQIYLTPKENLAVYIRNLPNWNYWSGSKDRRRRWPSEDWSSEDWSTWNDDENEYRLEVYASLEELESNVPPELFTAVAQALQGNSDGIEVLDI
jgi:EXLDI family protein